MILSRFFIITALHGINLVFLLSHPVAADVTSSSGRWAKKNDLKVVGSGDLGISQCTFKVSLLPPSYLARDQWIGMQSFFHKIL